MNIIPSKNVNSSKQCHKVGFNTKDKTLKFILVVVNLLIKKLVLRRLGHPVLIETLSAPCSDVTIRDTVLKRNKILKREFAYVLSR